MTHQECLEIGEIYALGALDEEERRQVEAHLASGCSVCETHIQEIRETLSHLPRSLTPQTTPPAIKAKLLDQIDEISARPNRDKQSFAWHWWGVGAGALTAAGLLIFLAWNLFTTRQDVVQLKIQIATLQIEAPQRDELIQLLSDRQVRVIQLAGLTASPRASGRLLWNSETRKGILLTTGLPMTEVGKEYELWAIAGKKPVPAGVFKVDQQGRALLRLPSLAEGKPFDKFAVTVEPAGGVPKPTGPMHLLGGL